MRMSFKSHFSQALALSVILGLILFAWTAYRTGQDAAVVGNIYALRKLVQQRVPKPPCKNELQGISDLEMSKYFPNGRGHIYDASWDQVIENGRIPDLWGTPIRTYFGVNSKGVCDFIVVSAGGDKVFDTSDDLVAGQ